MTSHSIQQSGPVQSQPLVGIIMGSDSDLPTMQAAADVLKKFDVPFELTIVSAHRTPDRMYDYAKAAAGRGLQVVIAGAGGAAHLPGMVASLTTLPVIGVPIKSANSLDGIDSLLSIAQMPPGVPVATVAVNGAMNAGILAVEIVALMNTALQQKLEEYKAELKTKVQQAVERLAQ